MTSRDQLSDQLALQELVSLHGHLVDDGDLADLDRIFLTDVTYDLTDLGGEQLVGIEAIERAARRLGDRNPVGHHVTNVVVTELHGDTARVVSKGIGVTAAGKVGSVVYEDDAVRTAEGWRIGRRAVRARRVPLTR